MGSQLDMTKRLSTHIHAIISKLDPLTIISTGKKGWNLPLLQARLSWCFLPRWVVAHCSAQLLCRALCISPIMPSATPITSSPLCYICSPVTAHLWCDNNWSNNLITITSLPLNASFSHHFSFILMFANQTSVGHIALWVFLGPFPIEINKYLAYHSQWKNVFPWDLENKEERPNDLLHSHFTLKRVFWLNHGLKESSV